MSTNDRFVEGQALPLPDRREAARRRYRDSLVAQTPLSGADLGAAFGLSDRWGRDRVAEVRADLANENDERGARHHDRTELSDLAAASGETDHGVLRMPSQIQEESIARDSVDRQSLIRVRWAVRLTLLLGVIASTLANVLHALPNPISQTIAAWPPLALLATIELISHVPVGHRFLAALRLLTAFGIAGIAAWVSYQHMVEVIQRFGERGLGPVLIPLTVDGLVIVSSICLTELTGRICGTAPAGRTARERSSTGDREVTPS